MEERDEQLTLAGLEAVELRSALAAERAARAEVERRFAETAHDLRATLASVAGYAQLLVEAIAADGPAPESPPAEAATLPPREIARRIADLAVALCAWSGGLTAAPAAARPRSRRVSARRLLLACAEAIEPQCRAKGLSLRLELPAAGSFTGDGDLIRRAVMNLLSNAVRYTERGEVSLRGELEREHLRIEVADTGVGIAPENHGRIFEESCRLDDGRRLEPHGSGLGLATVKRLCAAARARVEVRSTPGIGSAFTLLFPRRRPCAHPPQDSLFDAAGPNAAGPNLPPAASLG